ncbi:MAG: outer membrane protein assembly factor BamD [Bdellovibrionales bacterium]|nr:outer membrane protein assembly factor BamD [Bdellovibrionales bacterium]
MPWQLYTGSPVRGIKLLLLIGVMAFHACHKMTPDQFSDAKLLFEHGMKLYNNKEYTESIAYFESLKYRFPTSSFAPESELKIADAHFNRAEFLEATLNYQNFKMLYPSHPKVPYATYQMGLCYYEEAPTAIDRDQDNLIKAINTLNEVKEKWPTSKEAKKSETLITKARKAIYRREMYIANFYFKRKAFAAALTRYNEVRSQYNFPDLLQEASYKAAASQYHLKAFDAARETLEPIIKDKSSKYHKRSVNLLAKINESTKTN